jgi:HAE1 family hydrophobic/amphiphilic exporter-1
LVAKKERGEEALSAGSLLPRFSLRRPVTVMMLLIAAGTIGFLSYQRIPYQLYPTGYTPPFLYVRVLYPNSTPKEVEDKIVRPTEALFATIKGLTRLRTWASGSHGSFWMRFDSNIPMTTIYNQVRDRLERMMPTYPEEVQKYYIWKWNPEAEPILYFGISMEKNAPKKDSFRLLERHIFSKIRRLPGVSKVDVTGLDRPRIYIEIDGQQAKSRRISVYQLIRQLRRDNISVPSGQIREGRRVFYVRSHNRLQSLKALQDYPIAPGMKLSEVANIRYIPNSDTRVFRIDGRTGVFIEVHKESEANTVKLTQQVQQLVADQFAKEPELQPFRTHLFVDRGALISDAITQLQMSLLWGGLFALLILGMFLRHIRMTLLVMLAIPMSLLLTLASLYFMGESLNLFTLMGLMLSVGMVVDNAIVVVENIARLRQDNHEANASAEKGTAEVALAVLMATSTTIVVFLPLILMSGSRMFRFYMSKIGYPVSIALVASLLVALLFVPLGASRLLGQEKPKAWPLFDRLTLRYQRMLRWILCHRFDVALIALLLFMTIRIPMKNMKRTDQSRPKMTKFRLRFTFAKNYKYRDKVNYLLKIEKLLKKHKQAWGMRHFTMRFRSNSVYARFNVYLDPNNMKIRIDRRSLFKKIGPLLPEAPGVVRRIGWRPVGGSENSISLRLYGPDSATLERIATRLETHLKRYPLFRKVEAELTQDTLPEVQLQLQRQWAFRYQLSAGIVGGNVAYALSGRRLRNMQIGDLDIPVWIMMKPESRQNLHQLKQLPLRGPARSDPVPLGQLVTPKFTFGPRVINRVNRKTFLKVNIATNQADLLKLYSQLGKVMGEFPLPKGYSWDKGIRYRDLRQSDRSQQFALLLSITFVFLLMGILFESFLLPFSVLLSIPLAFLGVYWFLYLSGTSMDMMAGIGLVMLVGIVVNHAIVLIDRINQLREEGLPRDQAILEAGAQRLRPILMTTLTTICGLLPMAYGGAAFIGIPYAPLGRTVIGGLTVSALLSLLIIPIFYTYLDDMRNYFMQRISSKPKT